MMKPQTSRPNESGSYDNCLTPPYAVWPLLPYIAPRSVIWEPCAGDDYLADALRLAGHTVISTDKRRGQDLFTTATPDGVDLVVTNPPYSIKHQVIAELLRRGLRWALLVPYETLASPKTFDLFPDGESEEMRLDGRINFEMPDARWAGNGAQFEVMWLSYAVTGRQISRGALPHRLDFNRRVREVLDIEVIKDANGGKPRRIVRGRQPTRAEIFAWSGFNLETLECTKITPSSPATRAISRDPLQMELSI